MLSIEQFVYTTASTENGQGYQIVAKSNGITDGLLSKIESYLCPIGVLPSSFTESRSLVVLKREGIIVFSKIHNIGIGYDGRSNTLYNHSLVMSSDEFKQIDSDTRILEDFYFEDYDISGSLPQLRINTQKSTLPLEITQDIQKILPEIIYSIFNKKKILITGTKDIEFIQRILGLIPPSMRQISFSTMVMNIKKQPEYEIIMSELKIQEKFHHIDIKSPHSYPISKNKLFEEGINQYIKIISENTEKIREFFNEFDKLSGKDYKDKLIILTYLEMMNSIDDKNTQQDYAHVILEHLNKIEPISALAVFDKIKDKIPRDEIIRNMPRFEIPKIMTESKNMEINKDNIEKILNQLSNGTSDSRLQLLNEIINTRKAEFLEKGTQLLNDARYAYYGPDIYRAFVENDSLHKCIFTLFEINSIVRQYNKKQIFEEIFLIALKNKPQLVALLLDYEVYDLTDKYDAEDFKKLIKNLICKKKSISFDFETISDVCYKVFSKIQRSATKKHASDIFEITGSTIKQLVKTTKLLTEFVDETIIYNELNNSQRNRLTGLRTEMRRFVDKNDKVGFFDFFER